MDRTELSDTIIRELAELLVKELTKAAGELVEADLDGIEQRLQALGRVIFARVVEHTVVAIERAECKQAPCCQRCHQPMRLVDEARPRSLQGLVGDYRLLRAYFVCDGCHQGCAPLDERLGLGSGSFSPGLVRVACRLGIEKSFGQAADALGEALHIEVSEESVRRITEGIGQVAEAEQKVAIVQAQKGDDPVPAEQVAVGSGVLVVEVDGAMVHLQEDWHEVKVGVVGPLGPDQQIDPDSGRAQLQLAQPSYCAGLEKAEDFWYRVYAEACRRGLGSLSLLTIAVLGDGADWIWRYARAFVAVGRVQVVEIVDIFHAWEHLWTVANAVFGVGSAQAREWVNPLKGQLIEQGVGAVLEALSQLAAEDGEAAKEVSKAIAYFSEHASRMDYPGFIGLKLPIGSGAVEGACKVLIEEREKGAGMRWSSTGAQAVASLRALHRSGRWREFWRTHPQRRRPAASSRRPTPATAHSLPERQAA